MHQSQYGWAASPCSFWRTLAAWFRHNVQPLATSKALFIHRNTLEYRLNRISELTGLDLGNFDDRLLLYVALQLDEER